MTKSIEEFLFNFPPPEITYTNTIFCLTGSFEIGDRKDITAAIESLGGQVEKNVTKKVDILLVGSLGSEAWKFSSYGDKIEKALMLRQKGKDIKIVSEDHWINFLPSNISIASFGKSIITVNDFHYIPSNSAPTQNRLERASIITERAKIDYREYIAFDFETTGLSPYDEIIEIGAVKYFDGVKVDEFSSLIKPIRPIPKEATYVNGITNEMVYSEKPISHVLPDFLKFINTTTLIAHNLSFDEKFLLQSISDLGLKRINNKGVCTLTLSRRILKNLQNHKLLTVANHFGIQKIPTHRSLDDSIVCAIVFNNLLELIKDK